MIPLSVSTPAARFCAFYILEENTDVLIAIDEAGQLYEGGTVSWVAVGDRCPGEPPFDLLVLNRPDDEGMLYILVLDGEGQLHEFGDDEWLESGDKLPGEGPYRISGYVRSELGDVNVYALDSDGQLWLFGEFWETVAEPIDGIPPYDLDVLHYGPTGITLFLAMDSKGVLYNRFEETWEVHAEMSDADDPPYAVTGFYEPESLDVYLLAIDSTGQVYTNELGEFVAVGEPCTGEPPWDLEVVVHELENRYYLAALDSTGKFSVMHDDGSWELFFDSF